MDYKVNKIKFSKNIAEELELELKKMAQEGWELVNASTYSEAGFTQAFLEASTTSGYLLIFKK
jgi:hypothetical protein